MKIQVLMENTAGCENILTEHGLSLYIETGDHRILFDCGQSGNFAENAKRMGVDLSRVDMAVLSHGHYDHGGGLISFMEINPTAPIYVSQYAFEEHWHGTSRNIGLNKGLQTSTRLIKTGDFHKLDDGLMLYSCNGRSMPYGLDAAGLTVQRDGEFVPEDFRHEQYLLVEENGKKILFSGCSHKGILNIETWFQPDVLIGGFHLKQLDPAGEDRSRLQQTAELLQMFPTRYWTCHCTGVPQYKFLKEIMGPQLEYLAAGQTLCI